MLPGRTVCYCTMICNYGANPDTLPGGNVCFRTTFRSMVQTQAY